MKENSPIEKIELENVLSSYFDQYYSLMILLLVLFVLYIGITKLLKSYKQRDK